MASGRSFVRSRGVTTTPPHSKSSTRREQEVTTRFEDVEGIDSAKEELEEIVDFLKNPDKYYDTEPAALSDLHRLNWHLA